MTDARERPILFSGEMVKAILAGRKTQTRRVLTVPWRGSTRTLPYEPYWVEEDGRLLFCDEYGKYLDVEKTVLSPYGVPGDRLWVRETWGYRGQMYRVADPTTSVCIAYRADDAARHITRPKETSGLPRFVCRCKLDVDDSGYGPTPEHMNELDRYWRSWRPSLFLPRWASRITLEVTGVRVERLQDISEDDAIAEGCGSRITRDCKAPVFAHLWDSINVKRALWASNPWVWVVSFEVIHDQ